MIKSTIKSALTVNPAWSLARLALRPRGVTVLMYHRITSGNNGFSGTDARLFRQQMQWLKQRCRPIAPEELDVAAQRSPLDKPAVLVTFDDGYRDYHDHAYPVLSEYGIPSLVFLATGSTDKGCMIWTDAVTHAINQSDQKRVELPFQPGMSYALSSTQERQALALTCKEFLKNVTNQDRERWLAELYRVLKQDLQNTDDARQMLNWHEVRQTMPLTRFGGHTHNHPILSQLDPASMEDEIRFCKERIASETGAEPRFFAYPNGRAQDFNQLTKTLLKKHGFAVSFSTIEGIHQAGDDLYAVRRQHTGAKSLGDFAMRVLGH
jgi:peptidoglycan/xylan/chitin deacetylase (PgdA/CDA1 family)